LRHGDAWVGDLLDSQIDVDRMDFLLRDSLYTGVDYGRFDMQRVFHSLTIGEVEGENHLVMLLKGLHAFEGFFIARHHMYWQVYLHKVTRVYEILLEKIFCRMKELLLEKEIDIDIPSELKNLLIEERVSLEEFFLLDDCTILETIKKCYSSKDAILNDLSTRFLERKIFRCIKKKKIRSIVEFIKKSQEIYEKRNIPYEYYFAIDEPSNFSVNRPVLEKGLLMADRDVLSKNYGK
jgi:HD superfamily phosphohydrolase